LQSLLLRLQTRGGAVGWRPALQAGRSRFRYRMMSPELSLTWSFWPHYDPGVDSASNRNYYEEYFLREKGGRCLELTTLASGVLRGCLGEFNPPPPKFRRPSKIVPNSTRLRKLLKIAEFRKPIPQDARKRGSKILKLPPVRNCFTLAMTNKLVVIINRLKVPKN